MKKKIKRILASLNTDSNWKLVEIGIRFRRKKKIRNYRHPIPLKTIYSVDRYGRDDKKYWCFFRIVFGVKRYYSRNTLRQNVTEEKKNENKITVFRNSRCSSLKQRLKYIYKTRKNQKKLVFLVLYGYAHLYLNKFTWTRPRHYVMNKLKNI